MTETNSHDLMMEVIRELTPELRAVHKAPQAAEPRLSKVLAGFRPLPPGAVLLGVATDGLPVLLSLTDARPGPMLIAGDAGSGKTALLQVIARSIEECHEAREVQYGVITEHPDEWIETAGSMNRISICRASRNEGGDLIQSLDEWAHANHGDRQTVVLLIDDLSTIMQMEPETQQSLRWLLLRGPTRRVWPIVTINPKRVPDVNAWTAFFHTRLFGHIAAQQDAGNLENGSRPPLEALRAGREFMLREGVDWLRFWIPSLD